MDIVSVNKSQKAEMSRRMRTYMKIHNSRVASNKEAVKKLKSRIDSDGEELSVITSGISFNI